MKECFANIQPLLPIEALTCKPYSIQTLTIEVVTMLTLLHISYATITACRILKLK
jgi:hypothetical protein